MPWDPQWSQTLSHLPTPAFWVWLISQKIWLFFHFKNNKYYDNCNCKSDIVTTRQFFLLQAVSYIYCILSFFHFCLSLFSLDFSLLLLSLRWPKTFLIMSFVPPALVLPGSRPGSLIPLHVQLFSLTRVQNLNWKWA